MYKRISVRVEDSYGKVIKNIKGGGKPMKEISTSELQERLEKGEELHLIDVREAMEVAMGTIPGAVNIPLGTIPERLQELKPTTPYILICRSGNRSGHAAAFLEAQGYDVTNLVGGMIEWEGEVI